MVDLSSIFEMPEKEAVLHLYELYMNGATTPQLAKALDCTEPTVLNYFKRYKLPLKQRGGHYKGKDIKISREEYYTLTYKEIAKKHNISPFSVYMHTKSYPRKSDRFTPPSAPQES